MIEGFEQQTKALNEEDKELVRIISEGLNSMPKGKKYSSNISYFIERLATVGLVVDEIKLRKIFQYIRLKDLVLGLCSDSTGYWVTDSPEELEATIRSLEDRIKNQLTTIQALKRQLNLLNNSNKLY